MDTDAILEATHRIYQGDTSYPTSTDEDYVLRLGLLGDSVHAWATKGSEENIRWKELFVTLTSAATGEKTATANDTTYDAPDDFVELSSWVTITDSTGNLQYYEVISPDEVMSRIRSNVNGKFAYVTGNENTGYVININSPVAGTINYNYYKTPAIPTDGEDKLEMKRPYFAVHFILARLYELDSRNDLLTFHEQKAVNIINSMVIDNEILPEYNSNALKDLQYINSGTAFGV